MLASKLQLHFYFFDYYFVRQKKMSSRQSTKAIKFVPVFLHYFGFLSSKVVCIFTFIVLHCKKYTFSLNWFTFFIFSFFCVVFPDNHTPTAFYNVSAEILYGGCRARILGGTDVLSLEQMIKPFQSLLHHSCAKEGGVLHKSIQRPAASIMFCLPPLWIYGG